MKNVFNRLMGISLLSLLLLAGNAQTAKAQDVVVSYQTFYDNLAPYGQWVYDPDYGNVWVPNEAGDFRPYGSRGYWVMTDYGNTWVSEDPWGWAVYHYGRWTYDAYYGWVWIPGYEWAPAWVSWRYGGGYCGWVPMGPGVSVGVSFNYPDSWWIFVSPQYMYHTNCYSYWRGPQYNTTYIRQTTIINNYYVDNSTHVRYNYGPRRDVIERDTHQPVEVRRLERTNRPGAPNVNGNRVNMYRPTVDRGSRSNARPSNVIDAPRRVGRPEQANTVSANHQPAFRQEVQRRNPGVINNDLRQQQDRGRDPQQRQDRYNQAPDRTQGNNPQQREQRNDRQPGRDRNDQPQRQEPPHDQRNDRQPGRDQRNEPPQRQEPQRDQRNDRQPERYQRNDQQREQEQRDQQQRSQQMRDQQQRDQQQRAQQMRDQQQRDQQQRAQQMRDQQMREQQQRDQQQRNQQMRDQQMREQQQRDQQQRNQQMREQQQRQQQQAPRPEPQRQAPQGGGREQHGGRR